MKNLLSILVGLLVVVIGCKPDNYKDPRVKVDTKHYELDNTIENFSTNYRIYTLEGCEYIVAGVGNYQWGTHKGNCNNPIHVQNTKE
jgi:hypothetical protein